MLTRLLGSKYQLMSFVLSPVNLGIPAARRRKYTLCILQDFLREQPFSPQASLTPMQKGSEGPESEAEPHSKSRKLVFPCEPHMFRHLFYRTLEVDAGIYLTASDAQVQQDRAETARRRGLDTEFYRGTSQCHIVDLAQSPYYCGQAEANSEKVLLVVPALLRGSLMYALPHKRCLVAQENLLVQGIPVPGFVDPPVGFEDLCPHIAENPLGEGQSRVM